MTDSFENTSSVNTSIAIEPESLFADLDKGLLILTPNHRTNVQVIEAYGAHRREHALPLVCASPAIFPVDIWLQSCAENRLNNTATVFSSQSVLSSFQELLLWKSIIRDSDIGSGLLNIEGTANSAIEAHRMIQQWEISRAELENFELNSEQKNDLGAFLIWLKVFDETSRDNAIVSLSQLVKQVIDAIDQGLMSLPAKTILMGFDTPPPLYQRLFKALFKEHGEIQYHKLKPLSPQVKVKALKNNSAEILQAAQWAQNILSENSEARIAIICPELQANKKEIKRIFHNTFYPASILSKHIIKDPCFSLTVIENLDSDPLIHTILSLLKLNVRHLPTLELCQIIRSPFLIDAREEENARAALELHVRNNAEIKCSLATLRYLALREDKAYYCPMLGEALLAFEQLRQQHKKNNSLQYWSEALEQQLALLLDFKQWETSRSLKQWYELLEQLKSLTLLTASNSFSTASDLINQLARSTNGNVFFNQASVQILTPVDASGLRFSHLWCMGLSENNWPPHSRPNPFVPLAIQKNYQIPAASAELQFQGANALLQQFKQSTQDDIVFSYPVQADDIALEPSLLLQQFGEVNSLVDDSSHKQNLHPYSQTLIQAATKINLLEKFEDTLNIPLLDKEQAKGGTSLISDQANCPFRSFAKHRLKATDLPALSYGLPAFAVGNMVHYVLEVFWENLKSLSQLEALSEEALAQRINTAVAESVKKTSQRYPSIMTKRYCDLEVQRLSKLLHLWLQEERQRGAFTIVEHEYALQWQHLNLNLNFRIDRIERFEDQTIGLVDYKTSKASKIDWFDPRPDNPQLLLYLQAAEIEGNYKPVSSVLLAHIKVEEMKYVGISETSHSHPKTALIDNRDTPTEMTWEALKDSWAQSLQTLAQEFLDGYIAIEPKTMSSCQYCHLPTFCRIKEQNQRPM